MFIRTVQSLSEKTGRRAIREHPSVSASGFLFCRVQGGSGHLHNFIRLYPIHTVCKSGEPCDWRSKQRNNPKRFFGDAMTAHREHDTSALNASQHCAARQIAGIERYALTIKEQSDQATESSLFLMGAFETIDIFQYKEIQPWQR